MKQSSWASFVESAVNIIVGLGIALVVNVVMLNWYGFAISAEQNIAMGAVMTVASLLRSYGLRRLFEALHIRRPLSPFMQAVVAERYRQIEGEGWSLKHDDDEHEIGDLARAGACYALHPSAPAEAEDLWPWLNRWWNPQGLRRDLVKGCALIIAEGEKFDRARKSKRRTSDSTVTSDARAEDRSPLLTPISDSRHSPFEPGEISTFLAEGDKR